MKSDQSTQRIRHNSLDVYQHFIGSLYPYGRVKPGKNISNPLITTIQVTPSFRIFKAYDGSYLFIDSADERCKGDCITFIQMFKGLPRVQAIKEIEKAIKLN